MLSWGLNGCTAEHGKRIAVMSERRGRTARWTPLHIFHVLCWKGGVFVLLNNTQRYALSSLLLIAACCWMYSQWRRGAVTHSSTYVNRLFAHQNRRSLMASTVRDREGEREEGRKRVFWKRVCYKNFEGRVCYGAEMLYRIHDVVSWVDHAHALKRKGLLFLAIL